MEVNASERAEWPLLWPVGSGEWRKKRRNAI
jgi:hypothetical protein